MLNKAGRPVEAASIFLGDSVKVDSLNFEGGVATAALLVHGPLDAACCPTQPVTRQFAFDGKRLREVEVSASPAATVEEPSIAVLRNSSYKNHFAATGVITLTDGSYTSTAGSGTPGGLNVTLDDLHAFGDLNGDTLADAAVVLVSDTSTGGTFYDLHVLLSTDGKMVDSASVSLGDRIKLRFVIVSDGGISVGVATQSPQDSQ